MKILIMSPHGDDGVIGACGAIIKHIKKGDEVYYCVVTKGYSPDWSEGVLKEKRKEILLAAEMLGVKETYFLELPTVKLDTIPQKELNDLFSEYINKIRPEIVYIPHRGDTNNDHRMVFRAAMVATRPVPKCSVKKMFSYETLSSSHWTSFPEESFIPNVYLDISEALEEKIKIMSCFKTELKEYPHPRSLKAISVLAEKRGAEAGLIAAETFILIREILN